MNNEERKPLALLLILVATIAFGLGGVFMYCTRNFIAGTVQPVQTDVASAQTSGKQTVLATPEAPEAAFTGAMDRFGDAVRAHPEMSGEEMIAKVNAGAAAGSAKPCPFEWHNGEAELQIQDDRFGKPSLTNTVISCTAAIEHLSNEGTHSSP